MVIVTTPMSPRRPVDSENARHVRHNRPRHFPAVEIRVNVNLLCPATLVHLVQGNDSFGSSLAHESNLRTHNDAASRRGWRLDTLTTRNLQRLVVVADRDLDVGLGRN